MAIVTTTVADIIIVVALRCDCSHRFCCGGTLAFKNISVCLTGQGLMYVLMYGSVGVADVLKPLARLRIPASAGHRREVLR